MIGICIVKPIATRRGSGGLQAGWIAVDQFASREIVALELGEGAGISTNADIAQGRLLALHDGTNTL